MIVKDAIKYLKKGYKPNDEIVMAWWDKEMFDGIDDDNWSEACDIAEDIDWSHAHFQMMDAIRDNMEIEVE